MSETRKLKNRSMNMGPKEPLNFKTVKRLLKYITSKYKIHLIIVFICIIISAVVQVLGQLFLKSLIDDYISPLLLESNPIFVNLFKTLIFMAFIYLLGIVCTFIYNRIMVNISQGVLKDIRDDMFVHMETLPIKYFDTNSHGDIMSHYTNDTDALRQMISQSIPNFISSFISIVSVLIAMIYLNYLLTIVVILGAFSMFIISGVIMSKASKYFIAYQNSLGKVNGYIEEMIEGQKVIKVFTHEEKAKEKFDFINDDLAFNGTSANKFANIMMPLMMNIGNLVYVVVAIVGGIMAVSGNVVTLGVIASFLSFTKSFTQPISQVSQQINSIITAMAGATRIFALLDEKSETNSGTISLVNAKFINKKLVKSTEICNTWAWETNNGLIELKGDVRFNDVNFGYQEEKQVLYDINLYAKPGQKIAFVGSTGAGKTTITNLLNRFYDVDDGLITYDGININDINKKSLRLSLGMVLQDTNLFTGTIMDNIRYGRIDATDDECMAAATLANAADFINLLPEGYNTMLTNNGTNLSQGQRQLLSIARCAVANPPVMILDEATSSIDTRTERLIQEGMDKIMNNRTVFVIAHRLSTVKNASSIMVLENGHIIERGDHDVLLEQKGKYYQLYTGLFELE